MADEMRTRNRTYDFGGLSHREAGLGIWFYLLLCNTGMCLAFDAPWAFLIVIGLAVITFPLLGLLLAQH
jgi:hypothetical protein